ncbi:MAG: helicase [Cyanobacteria bacterium DS2.3.42]|nr:helicase [Cyanobacteria bacterium DS2.3.42]
MQRSAGKLIFSPSDLIKFMESEFITWMDRFDLERPGIAERDPESETDKILQARGIAHEAEFLAQLRADGREITDISAAEDRFAATIAAMHSGADIIYQGALREEVSGEARGSSANPSDTYSFLGYADFLERVPGASTLGDYHYEPWDTKLALKEKPPALIQLSCYADLLALIQGVTPKRVHIVLGDKRVRSFRTDDYIYYYRQMRKAFVEQQANFDAARPPEFTGLEEFGRWSTHAKNLMETQDHLCRVANIRTVQFKKLHDAGIATMTDLATSSLTSIPKMKQETFATLKQQARLQIESKGLSQPKFEVINPQLAGFGLTLLPPPSPLDVYFDMEGFPLAEGGLEYLFGATIIEAGELAFKDWWAHDANEEKAAFEAFVTWAHDRWKQDAHMHIYHYAAYEKTALRRLMGKYGTRESEVDDLLRNEVFVDLYSVVRQAIKVGEPKYSIKNIEHLYMEKRAGDVATAMDSVVFYQRWLDEQDGTHWQTSKILGEIRAYNKEDCDSTYMLAEWLRRLQAGENIPPRVKQLKLVDPDSPNVQARSDAAALAATLLEGVSQDPKERTEDMRLRSLLAHVLEFHWREAKPVFWAKFDRADMTDDERFEDAGCLAGLERTSTPPIPDARSILYEYQFDANQDTKIDAGNSCFFADDLEQKITVAEIDTDRGIIRLKRGNKMQAPPDRLSLIKDEFVDAKVIAQSILRTAQKYSQGEPLPSALNDFLLRSSPRVNGSSGALIQAGENLTDGTTRVIQNLQNSTLCIQGPPGAGKTYTASRAICALIRDGKKVGVTSNSHKAIAHLMDKVAAEAAKEQLSILGFKLQSNVDDYHVQSSAIVARKPGDFFKNDANANGFNLVGGTAWAFSNLDAEDLVDYLFVDEAGQVSIANLVGMAPSAKNLVLIGDQMQLSQPIQGSHPGESGKSLLEYLLQDQQVVPDDFGIFLGKTWRMHPDVCSFISGAVYEDRLHPEAHTTERTLKLPDGETSLILRSSGLIFVPVMHEGNNQDSEEESAAIVDIVKNLLNCQFIDRQKSRKIELNDILLVAPYNMQVRRLRGAIPGCRAGSVDKFQGQEAPVVIVSMCSSTGDSSSRGLEFIFSKNRLNVAISRAQVLAIVVGSPALSRTHCNHVPQMELVNLFCRIQAGFDSR